MTGKLAILMLIAGFKRYDRDREYSSSYYQIRMSGMDNLVFSGKEDTSMVAYKRIPPLLKAEAEFKGLNIYRLKS